MIVDSPLACAVQINIKITTKSDDADISLSVWLSTMPSERQEFVDNETKEQQSYSVDSTINKLWKKKNMFFNVKKYIQ